VREGRTSNPVKKRKTSIGKNVSNQIQENSSGENFSPEDLVLAGEWKKGDDEKRKERALLLLRMKFLV